MEVTFAKYEEHSRSNRLHQVVDIKGGYIELNANNYCDLFAISSYSRISAIRKLSFIFKIKF